MAKKAVAKKSSAVALADQVGDETGMEGMGSDDFAIPFVRVLQDNSPQVKSKKAEYIDGAVSSMFLNTGTQEIYEGQEIGLRFVPCVFQRKIVEWIPVDDGGGFVGAHELDAQIVKDAIVDGPYKTTPDGHDLVDTIYYFGQIINEDGDMSPAVMAMASTQLKKAKNWNNRLGSLKLERSNGSRVNAPMWSHSWNITTVFESNDKGDWYGLKITDPQPVELEQYTLAGDFRDLVKSGAAKMANPSDDPIPASSDEDDGAFD